MSILAQVTGGNSDTNIEDKTNIITYNTGEDYKYIKGIKLIDINIPNSYYNIHENNNTFDVKYLNAETIDTITYTIDTGNYSLSALINAINDKVTAAHDVTFSYDDTTKKTTATSSDATREYVYFYNDPILQMLGFTLRLEASTSDSEDPDPYMWISTGVVDISGIKSFNLHSANISKKNNSTSSNNHLLSVPILNPIGSITYTKLDTYYNFGYRIVIEDDEDIDFYLTSDMTFDDVYLNGLAWTINIEFVR